LCPRNSAILPHELPRPPHGLLQAIRIKDAIQGSTHRLLTLDRHPCQDVPKPMLHTALPRNHRPDVLHRSNQPRVPIADQQQRLSKPTPNEIMQHILPTLRTLPTPQVHSQKHTGAVRSYPVSDQDRLLLPRPESHALIVAVKEEIDHFLSGQAPLPPEIEPGLDLLVRMAHRRARETRTLHQRLGIRGTQYITPDLHAGTGSFRLPSLSCGVAFCYVLDPEWVGSCSSAPCFAPSRGVPSEFQGSSPHRREEV